MSTPGPGGKEENPLLINDAVRSKRIELDEKYEVEGLGERGHQWTEVISLEPLAFIYHNFLSNEECEYLINLARPHLVRTLVNDQTGKSIVSRHTSYRALLEIRGRDKVIRAIEQRIADYTLLPVEYGSGLQVLRYEVGQKQGPHFDYHDKDYGRNGGRRMLTLVMYLSDVEEGGETVFPNAKTYVSSVAGINGMSECAKRGLSVKPKKGNALLFWSMRGDMTRDPSSLHGASPVISGEKWACTMWIHEREFIIGMRNKSTS